MQDIYILSSRLVVKGKVYLQARQLYGYSIVLGHIVADFYKISKDILGTRGDFFLHITIKPDRKLFVATRNISIPKAIDKVSPVDIYVGGDSQSSIPEREYMVLLKNFPNTYELDKYADARVASIVKDFIEATVDAELAYTRLLNKKVTIEKQPFTTTDIIDNEILKYDRIHNEIANMLQHENEYSEHQWQKRIIEIILLLFPKYIRAFSGSPVEDAIKLKRRKLDMLLIDFVGNIDILEIKKPFDKCIMTGSLYRDNHIPTRELSGTIMQVEKYILHLNKWGKRGEDFLLSKYRDKLPDGFTVRITNPKGIIIAGRDCNLTPQQLADFEVVKRKYHNISDILTYDDLLRRVRYTLMNLRQKQPQA